MEVPAAAEVFFAQRLLVIFQGFTSCRLEVGFIFILLSKSAMRRFHSRPARACDSPRRAPLKAGTAAVSRLLLRPFHFQCWRTRWVHVRAAALCPPRRRRRFAPLRGRHGPRRRGRRLPGAGRAMVGAVGFTRRPCAGRLASASRVCARRPIGHCRPWPLPFGCGGDQGRPARGWARIGMLVRVHIHVLLSHIGTRTACVCARARELTRTSTYELKRQLQHVWASVCVACARAGIS